MIAATALLEPIVRVRRAIETTHDPELRDELREIEVALRRQLGPSTPKRAAARLLGVSVTALDRWIDRGLVPVVASPRRSKRLAVETGPLLELATGVRRLRATGCSHAVVSRAIHELGRPERGHRLVFRFDVARLPRPNAPLDELRQQFRATTPEERVLQMAALHRSLNTLT